MQWKSHSLLRILIRTMINKKATQFRLKLMLIMFMGENSVFKEGSEGRFFKSNQSPQTSSIHTTGPEM